MRVLMVLILSCLLLVAVSHAQWRPDDLGEAIRAQQPDLERALANRGVLRTDQTLQELASELLDVLDLGDSVSGTVKAIRQADVNAIMLPNGDIYLYDGLLSGLQSVEELAFILAHEASHALANDLVRKMDFRVGSNDLKAMELRADKWALERLRDSGLATSELDALFRRLYALSPYQKTVDLEARLRVVAAFEHQTPGIRLPERMLQTLRDSQISAIESMTALGQADRLLSTLDASVWPDALMKSLNQRTHCQLERISNKSRNSLVDRLRDKAMTETEVTGFWQAVTRLGSILGSRSESTDDIFLSHHGNSLDVLQISRLMAQPADCHTQDREQAIIERMRWALADHWVEVSHVESRETLLTVDAHFIDAYGLAWSINESLITTADGSLHLRLIVPSGFYHQALHEPFNRLVSLITD